MGISNLFGGMVDGFGTGQDFYAKLQKNKMAQDEASRYGAKLDKEQEQLNYMTGIAATKNKYLPEEMRLANQNAGLVNQFYAPNMQSQIAGRNADTANTQAQTKFLPLNELIKAQASTNSSKRFGASYELRQALAGYSPAERTKWIGQNQEAYSDMLTNIGNGQHEPDGITPQVMAKFFPEMGISAPKPGQQFSDSRAMQQLPGGLQKPPMVPDMKPQGGASLYPPQAQGAPPIAMQPQGGMGAPMPQQPAIPQIPPQRTPFLRTTPEQNAELKKTAEMSANQYLTTAATRRQMEGAIQVEHIVNAPWVQQTVMAASEYAGAVGKGKAALTALSQTNPEAYESYKTLKDVIMPLLNNRIKTLDQMGGTDKQREELNGFYEKAMNSWSSNPREFIKQYNAITKTLDTIAYSVQGSASPVADVNRLSGSTPLPENGSSSSMVQIKLPDGRIGNIPSSNLDSALKMGAKKVS